MNDCLVELDSSWLENSLVPLIDLGDELPAALQPAESRQKTATHKIWFVIG